MAKSIELFEVELVRFICIQVTNQGEDVAQTIERSSVKEVLRAVLHAILFQRTLGVISPRTIECMGLTFCAIAPSSSDAAAFPMALIDSKIDQLVRDLASSAAGSLHIRLSEKRTQKSKGWFAASRDDQDEPFEEWIITVKTVAVTNEKEKSKLEGITRRQLAAFLRDMISFCSGREHIPPITNSDLSPFPLDILVNPRKTSRRTSSPSGNADSKTTSMSSFPNPLPHWFSSGS